MLRKCLTKEEVIAVIERKSSAAKIPLVFHKWWGIGLKEKHQEKLDKMAGKYPDDIFVSFYDAPGIDKGNKNNPEYRWGYCNYDEAEKHSIGNVPVLLPCWNNLKFLLNKFPDPYESISFDNVKKSLSKAGDRYKLGGFWSLFHERFWTIRGMENLMLDYYDNLDKLAILGEKLLEYYRVIVDRYAELGFNGIFASDDLGHQEGPMMSPEVFKELYLPLYKKFVEHVHSREMHFFLHSCGDNTRLMDLLIEAGVDVFHPVQKGCMDYQTTAKKYNDKITFLVGIDVQHLLQEINKTDIEKEINNIIKIFYKKKGGLLLAAGNGILPDASFKRIDCMLRAISAPNFIN